MKTMRISWLLPWQRPFMLLLILPFTSPATTLYVWQESQSPAPPYTNWATASQPEHDPTTLT